MARLFSVSLCALLCVAMSATAAQVTWVNQDANGAGANNWQGNYGASDYWYWNFSSGKPNYDDFLTKAGGG